MDFLIIVLSVISLAFEGNSQFKIVKIFRLIRVMRPLRLISRNKMLKIAIHALGMAIPSIFNVIIVSMLFFIIFGIIGVNYFKGAFYYCVPIDGGLTMNASLVTNQDCLNQGGTWLNQDQNFDNMGQALSTLF
jgi:hypothetical protein